MDLIDLTESQFTVLTEGDFLVLAEVVVITGSSVVPPSTYRYFAGVYGNIKSAVNSIHSPLYDAVQIIVDFDKLNPTEDLLFAFNNTYTYVSGLYKDTPLLPAVRALNQHVINRGNYQSIDSYIAMNSFTVPQAWADLCALTGVTISPSNISG